MSTPNDTNSTDTAADAPVVSDTTEPAAPTPSVQSEVTPEASAAPADEAAASPSPDSAPGQPAVEAPAEAAAPDATAPEAAAPETQATPGDASAAKTVTDSAGSTPAPPKPVPSGKPRPGAAGSKAPAPEAPAVEALTPEKIAEQAAKGRQFGRVGENNEVFLTTEAGEVPIGSYPGVTEDEALAYFVRKYEELNGQVTLVEQRLAVIDPPVKEVAKSIRGLVPAVAEAHVLGDITALRSRLAAAETTLAEKKAEQELARIEAKKQSAEARELIVSEAEKIAGTPPAQTGWKASGDRMKVLFDEWKTSQKQHARLDKPVEDSLWQRFRAARNTFDRNRRAHFAQLDAQHGEVKVTKEKLIAEAEKLSSSTDWGATSAAYRDLMTEWKKAGRASRKDDDALWARFRAAQDVFFNARTAANAEQDKEFTANLAVKEALLQEAEALLPIKDVKRAKRDLREIGKKWDEAGKVPRSDMNRIEKRMRAVEEAIRGAEQAKWKSSNPEVKARAEGALGQLQDTIAGLEADLEKAKAKGDQKSIKKAEEALSARRAWLEQIEKAAKEYS